jgi:hypothetical protein
VWIVAWDGTPLQAVLRGVVEEAINYTYILINMYKYLKIKIIVILGIKIALSLASNGRGGGIGLGGIQASQGSHRHLRPGLQSSLQDD